MDGHGETTRGIQTPIKLSLGAICQDIGSRSRAAFRDRAHRDDRRVGVLVNQVSLVLDSKISNIAPGKKLRNHKMGVALCASSSLTTERCELLDRRR